MLRSEVKKYSTRIFGREKEKNTKRNCRKGTRNNVVIYSSKRK
jgi:hypothetical protein